MRTSKKVEKVMRRFLVASLVLMVAGCGGGGGGGGTTPALTGTTQTTAPASTTAPTAAPTATPAPTPTVAPQALQTATLNGSQGYVNGSGRTVYVLSADRFNSSVCTASSGCTGVWPIVTPPPNTTLSSPWGSFVRADSTTQLTYSGNPLYTYAGDSASGQTNGQGINSFGGTWSIARPNMAAAPQGSSQNSTPTPAPTATGNNCPGGYC
ncbi:MAG: hypothetical protein JOY59_11710 [Candidatus Eremiobacteraeota bacterium]|nr:hypothetical protein [Candidatus Eremiobacteraeota bacterium]